jgi:hypothetical protein
MTLDPFDRHHEWCSIGSRVHLVLGTHSNQWYLALDYDDTSNGKRQERHWSDLPLDLTQKLQACSTSHGWYVRMDLVGGLLEPENPVAWYIAGVNQALGTSLSRWSSDMIEKSLNSIIKATDPSVELLLALGERNGSFSVCHISDTVQLHNLSPSLKTKILSNDTGAIKTIRLFHDGAFFVRNDRNEYQFGGAGIPTACWRELSQGLPVSDLAVSADSEWVILRPDTFVASQGIDPILREHLDEFYRHHLLERRGRQQAKLADERARQAQQQVQLADQLARTSTTLRWLARHPPLMLNDMSEHHNLGERAKQVVATRKHIVHRSTEAREQAAGLRGQALEGSANRRFEGREQIQSESPAGGRTCQGSQEIGLLETRNTTMTRTRPRNSNKKTTSPLLGWF